MTGLIHTEFDEICRWDCECGLSFLYMYLAEEHQCKTDHCMERVILDMKAFDKLR